MGKIWNCYLLTVLTWNRRDSTPLSAAPQAPSVSIKDKYFLVLVFVLLTEVSYKRNWFIVLQQIWILHFLASIYSLSLSIFHHHHQFFMLIIIIINFLCLSLSLLYFFFFWKIWSLLMIGKSILISPLYMTKKLDVELPNLQHISKLATVVEDEPKAPYSIATTPRCRWGPYSFPGLFHFTLDPYLIMLSVKQGGIKYHFLSLWYDLTRDWTPVSRVNTLTIMREIIFSVF